MGFGTTAVVLSLSQSNQFANDRWKSNRKFELSYYRRPINVSLSDLQKKQILILCIKGHFPRDHKKNGTT